MSSVLNALMRTANKASVALYRRSNGKIAGKAAGGLPVLLLTVAGRKTGKPHTVPVAYFEYEGGYLVVGSAGGAKHDPQWVRNIGASGRAEIQVREHVNMVTARVTEGTEHENLWNNVVLARAPFFAKYETKSGRKIPVVVLEH